MRTLELLEKLSNAFGPPGAEEPVRELIVEALRGRVDEMRVDALGNLMVRKRGTGRRKATVLAAAHMDEVALMVMGVEQDGTLRFRAAGGLDDRVLLGKSVLVGAERVPGVIGVRPIHLLKSDERTAVVKMDHMRIDVGAESREAAAQMVKPGDHAVFTTQYGALGTPPPARRRGGARQASRSLVKGKAFDDRAGCTALVELLRGEPFRCDFYGVFTVQEEIGSRGGRVAPFSLEPDAAFALEGTTADDLPKEDRDVSPSTVLGRGPALTVMDRSVIADRRLLDHLMAAARAAGIPFQFKQPGTGGTDAGPMSLSRAGVPAAVVSIPCRYIHSPASILDVDDLLDTIKLMRAALDRFTPDVLARP